MSASEAKALPALGFLTVLEQADGALCGGYLLLNTSARPLEFHCTAAVRPNRAQEILYGPTLRPFVYGEQIGQALLAKSSLEPLWVCTDVEPALAVREFVKTPVGLVKSATQAADEIAGSPTHRLDSAHQSLTRPHISLVSFVLGGHQLAIAAAHGHDQTTITERWSPYAETFDLTEPFARIREALEEAHRGAKPQSPAS